MALDPAAMEAVDVARDRAAGGDDYELRALEALRDYPVAIEQFLTDPAYLGSDALYPAVLNELVELNNPLRPGCDHRARLWTPYSEAVLTGGIGSAKTTIALLSTAYQL